MIEARGARLAVFAIVVAGLAASYALITPAFEVPDEVAHYWRATAAAYGHAVVGERVRLPRGYRIIVWALMLTPEEPRVTPERIHRARGALLQDELRDKTPIAGLYSPAAYVPQIAAAAVARVAAARPFYQFFGGRLATALFCAVALALIARAAPAFQTHIEAAALLPMSLFLFGSWSADALTIVAAFLASALLLRAIAEERAPVRGELAAIVAAVAWLSLCKPPYVLIALLVLVAPVTVRFKALVGAVMVAGTIAASAMTMTGMEMPNPRFRPIDTRSQLRFIASDPLHFAGVIAHDLRANGRDYFESMTGRLGRYELKLPQWVTILLWAMLIAVGVACGPPLPIRARLLVVAVAVAIWLATVTYLYLTSSIAGGDIIEGTQGRYLVPLLPLLMSVLRVRRVRVPVPAIAVYVVIVAANAIGLSVLLQHFY